MTDPVVVAKEVLTADGHPFSTLSLAPGLPPVTVDTPVSEARRNYMRLAGLIHPDKIKGSYDKATEAFQCLVRAFETFADAKRRKAAAAADAKKASKVATAKRVTKAMAATRTEVPRPSQAKKSFQKKKAPAQVRRTKAKHESESEAENERDEDDASAATATESDAEREEGVSADESGSDEIEEKDAEPVVSDSRAPIGKPRTGGIYTETTVGCPHCRTRWEPDAKPQYSLFMGPWGKHVHCQLCLFVFGSATALHGCPYCAAPFDYDSSMYEETITCVRCKRAFGFPYYPVNQHLVDQICSDEWRARKEQERARERESRVRARNRGQPDADEAAERFSLLLGTCVMNEQCPLCKLRVRARHRAHVEACVQREKDGGKPSVDTSSTAAAKPGRKQPAKRGSRAATAVKSTASATTAPAITAAKKPAAKKAKTTNSKDTRAAVKKRGRDSDDDDSEESDADDEDEEEELSSDASESEVSSSDSEASDADADEDSDE